MGEDKERMLRGDRYLDEPDLAEDRRRCWRTLDRSNATGADDDERRATIGENAVVGAGSVVTRDVADHTLAVGNLARPVRRL